MATVPAITRVRTMPWVMVFELALTLRKHWRRLEPKDRARLTELVKKSQGRPGNLTAGERKDVRKLVAKLEPGSIARSVMPIGRRAVKSRKRV
ncbi:MAG: hypothetical protein QOG15_1166 [Solirubrobacteraceae bacterium]|jgi:hypothetical protein|nr:hypothetical protein [Solirubrobacteraceae bacterium]